jgi:hypothetical protein
MRFSETPLIGVDPALSPGALDFGRVLFLDFDGVLHPQTFSSLDQFCYMDNFCDAIRIVDPLHRLPIVISSTWRHHYTLQHMRALFSPDVGQQVVGVTPYLSIEEPAGNQEWLFLGDEPLKVRHRQREILMWLHTHAPDAQWLAIDDRPGYFEDDCKNLFTVPGLDGATEGGLDPDVTGDLMDRLKAFLDA